MTDIRQADDRWHTKVRLKLGNAQKLFHQAQTVREFMQSVEPLAIGEALDIVDEAERLFRGLYVHLPEKKRRYGVDPIARLRILRSQLQGLRRPGQLPDALEFHREMRDIFCSVRDRHTQYILPSPFRGRQAVLPFLIEESFPEDHNPRVAKYLVSKLAQGFKDDSGSFKRGVEITHWNGVPIDRAIRMNGHLQLGNNPEAFRASGIAALTLRAVDRNLAPDEEWVVVGYKDLAGQAQELRFEWKIVQTPERNTDDASRTRKGLDSELHSMNLVKVALYAKDAFDDPSQWFRCSKVGDCGYIRVFTFHDRDDRRFIRRFRNELELLQPMSGLIVDVRGNAGGYIDTAERLLQILAPPEVSRIDPEPAEMICSENAQGLAKWDADDDWAEAISWGRMQNQTHCDPQALTDPEDCNNDLDLRCGVPVVLITDALTYSAADIFAAGFQDNGIGKVIGVHATTGAGGAEVRETSTLEGWRSYKALPGDVQMSLAVRRTIRVRQHAGQLLEDIGVMPDYRYWMSKGDLEDNADLLAFARKVLKGDAPQLKATARRLSPVEVKVLVEVGADGPAWIEALVSDTHVCGWRPGAEATVIEVAESSRFVTLKAFDEHHQFVMALRVPIES